MAHSPPFSGASRPSAASRKEAPLTPAPSGAIRSLEAADDILRQLGELDAIQARVSADCDARCRSIRADFNGRLFVDVAGERMAIADQRQKLQTELETFCATHRDELLADSGKKSVELNHGTIGWRSTPRGLAPIEGGDAAGNATILDAIVAHLARALEKFELFRKAIGTLRFFTLQVKFDRKALLAAADKNELSAAELKKCGFVVIDGVDQFFAKPRVAELASRPTTAVEPEGAD